MSIDGAFEGHRAVSAMKMAMGARAEGEPAPSTKEERRAEMEAATMGPWSSEDGYNQSALYAAKMILQTVESNSHIDWASVPTEPKYAYLDEDGNVAPRSSEVYEQTGTWTKVEGGWYDMLKEAWDADDLAMWDSLGLSGFQWGWAVNTVRWVLDLPAVGNPAIVEIG